MNDPTVRTKSYIPFLFSLALALLLFGSSVPAQGQSFSPPPAPVRQPGEFEPMEGVLIRYPFGVPYELIAEMSEDAEVVTIVLDQREQDIVEIKYQANSVDLNNCSFLHAPSDTHWTRDYGPWYIITGNQEQGIADNGSPWNDPNDDLIPLMYGLDQGIPVYDTGIYHEGGNYMTDGQGSAISLDWVWNNNPGVPHENIYDAVLEYLGVDNYLVLTDAMGKYFYHIDCFAKYLSPDTIMVLELPPSHVVYNYLEEKAEQFESMISCYGTPYKVFRVYSPGSGAYINSLIMNNKVLLPFAGNQWDDVAVASYEAAMPGYEVLGFEGTWSPFDALHCRTMGITDRYMLYINHTPLPDRPPTGQGFPIEAEVIPYSGQGFTGGTPMVYWETSGGWNTVPMTNVSGNDFLAHIPAQPNGTTVQYYINAVDASGRNENHPYIGESDAHTFTANHLGGSISAMSANAGGVVDFYMNAGSANCNRDYILLGSVSGTQPGTPLPGGQTLPLNWDLFTGMTFVHANTPFFPGFQGTLDASGFSTAQFDTLGALPREAAGVTMNFAFLLYSPYDFVSNPVTLEISE